MRKERTTLNISLEAKVQLDSVKSSGQSYDGIIRELVKFYKETSKDYSPGEESKGKEVKSSPVS